MSGRVNTYVLAAPILIAEVRSAQHKSWTSELGIHSRQMFPLSVWIFVSHRIAGNPISGNVVVTYWFLTRAFSTAVGVQGCSCLPWRWTSASSSYWTKCFWRLLDVFVFIPFFLCSPPFGTFSTAMAFLCITILWNDCVMCFRFFLSSLQAREAGTSQNKWLMVNIQNVQEFKCQVLNRDIWSNATVKTLVKKHFIFWQVGSGNVYNDRSLVPVPCSWGTDTFDASWKFF